MHSPPVIATVPVDRNEAGQFGGILLAKMRNGKQADKLRILCTNYPIPHACRLIIYAIILKPLNTFVHYLNGSPLS